MELKDKLNLLWKYLILAVFTYGVVNLTCCKNSSSNCCQGQIEQVVPCKVNSQPNKKACGSNCLKPCCDKNK